MLYYLCQGIYSDVFFSVCFPQYTFPDFVFIFVSLSCIQIHLKEVPVSEQFGSNPVTSCTFSDMVSSLVGQLMIHMSTKFKVYWLCRIWSIAFCFVASYQVWICSTQIQWWKFWIFVCLCCLSVCSKRTALNRQNYPKMTASNQSSCILVHFQAWLLESFLWGHSQKTYPPNSMLLSEAGFQS